MTDTTTLGASSGEPVPLPEPYKRIQLEYDSNYSLEYFDVFVADQLIAYGDARARAVLLSARPPELDMTVASIFKRGVQSGIEQERERVLSATLAAAPKEPT